MQWCHPARSRRPGHRRTEASCCATRSITSGVSHLSTSIASRPTSWSSCNTTYGLPRVRTQQQSIDHHGKAGGCASDSCSFDRPPTSRRPRRQIQLRPQSGHDFGVADLSVRCCSRTSWPRAAQPATAASSHEQAATSAAGPGRSSSAAPRLWPTGAAAAARRPVRAKNAQRTPNLARGPSGDNRSMTPTDAQQQQLLEQLRQAGDEPLPFARLHAAGITFPAAVVSELELNGYVIQRVYEHGRPAGVRLLKPEPPVTSSAPRWRRSHQ